jgi:hypothetical protein
MFHLLLVVEVRSGTPIAIESGGHLFPQHNSKTERGTRAVGVSRARSRATSRGGWRAYKQPARSGGRKQSLRGHCESSINQVHLGSGLMERNAIPSYAAAPVQGLVRL